MRKNLLSLQRLALVALFAVIGLAQSWAADPMNCYSVGVAHCILNDGSGTFPVTEAGQVFVSLTPDVEPVWVDGTYTSEVAVDFGNPTNMTTKRKFYFWAKAKPGYKFIGWNTSKTGKTPSGGSANYEGKAWGGETATGGSGSTTTYTHSSATQSETAPKMKTLYAIFEKTEDDSVEPTGEGAAFVSAVIKGTEGLEFSEGSMSSKPAVNVTFAEVVNYTKAPDPGQLASCINADVVKFVTVTCKETGKALASTDFTVSATGTYVPGTTDIYVGEEGYVAPHYENGIGVIQLPTTLAKGTYTIHLPYGLYATVGEKGVSNACDIVVTVTEAKQVPMAVVSTTPSEGYEWDAYEGSTSGVGSANDNYDGIPGTITVIFDQPIAEVVEGKTPTLVKLDNNHSFKCAGYSKPILQTAQAKATLNVKFAQLPSGQFKCTIPAGIVKSQTGVENEEIVINFSVKANQYSYDEWTLVEYNKNTATPSNNSSVDKLDKITINFARDGYAAPKSVKGTPVVTFQDYVEDWSAVDPNAAEAKPKVITTDLNLASTVTVEDGKVVIALDKEYTSFKNQTIIVSIPADIVYNVEGAEGMTAQQLCEADGCKSPAMTLKLSLNAIPTTELPISNLQINDWSIYGGNIQVMGRDAEGNYVSVEFTTDGNIDYEYCSYADPEYSWYYAATAATGTYTETEEAQSIDATVTFENGKTYHITGSYVKPVWTLGDPEITLTDETVKVVFDVTSVAKEGATTTIQPSINLTLGEDIFSGGCGEVEAVDGTVTIELPLEQFYLGWTTQTPEFKAGDVVTVSFKQLSVYNNFTDAPYETIWDAPLAKTYDVTVTAATAIKNINAVANNNVMFNIAGQRVNNAKGIVIMNGKKVVK